jgi:anti-sigma regulatory factor (Ser/Thr protein kinase)
MITMTCRIAGGDYDRGGVATRMLKDHLTRIGVEAQALRRAMIAAYEAEMNVVIHAHRGTMKAVLDGKQARVEVIDEGPGIADTGLAMTEGYSTAGRQARRLGFGAGMGLSNIRKSVDCFTLESTVGKGTRLCFTICLKPQTSGADKPNSRHVARERRPLCRTRRAHTQS